MNCSPRSKLSSPLIGTKKLTTYFSPSTSPRKQSEKARTDSNKKPRLSNDAGIACVDMTNPNMDVSIALQRIERCDIFSATIRSVRAGDDGVFLVRLGAMIGRSVNPIPCAPSEAIRSRLKKMSLGIYGPCSGVSRKQLIVKQVLPFIKLKQLPGVTNQVYVIRYNPLTRQMAPKGSYIRKGDEFELKKGDVLVMDNGREKPNYSYRVVECYVPRQVDKAALRLQTTPPAQTIDLVSETSKLSSKSSSQIPTSLTLPDRRVASIGSKSFEETSNQHSPFQSTTVTSTTSPKDPRDTELISKTALIVCSQRRESYCPKAANSMSTILPVVSSSDVIPGNGLKGDDAEAIPATEVSCLDKSNQKENQLGAFHVSNTSNQNALSSLNMESMTEIDNFPSRTIFESLRVEPKLERPTTPEKAPTRKTRQSRRTKETNGRHQSSFNEPDQLECVETIPSNLQKKQEVVKESRDREWDIATDRAPLSKTKKSALMREMPFSISGSYVRMMNSSDPSTGSDLLIQMAEHHNRGMNSSSGRQIRDLLCHGPVSEGTEFPDPHRVEIALMYLDKLLACEGGEANISRSCAPSDWSAAREMVEKVLTLRYVCDGDLVSVTADGWDRVIESLHLSKCGMIFLNMLIMVELRGEIGTTMPDKAILRNGRLISSLWSNDNGARNSVKAIAKLFVRSWLQTSHFMLCDFATIKVKPGAPSSTAICRCREEAKKMLRESGTFVSYILWLYVALEPVRVSSRELACILKEAYDSETTQINSDRSVFMEKKMTTSYLKKQKLNLIMFIDETIVPGLRLELAKKLGVEVELRIMND